MSRPSTYLAMRNRLSWVSFLVSTACAARPPQSTRRHPRPRHRPHRVCCPTSLVEAAKCKASFFPRPPPVFSFPSHRAASLLTSRAMAHTASPPPTRLPGTVRVINASLSRTGTASMAEALAILLDAPSYHCGTDGVFGADAPVWAAAARAVVRPDWAALLDARGYASIGDAPACNYWAELAAMYPDAKVLLVERGEPGDRGAWADSYVAAVTAVAPFFRTRWRSRPARDAYDICTRMAAQNGGGISVDDLSRPGTDTREMLTRWYDRHYSAVRAGVPPKRLVVVPLGGGWTPLCEALHLPVPAVDFPQEHVGAASVAAISEAAATAMRPPPALVVAAAGAAVAAAGAAAIGVWRATRGGCFF